MTVISATDDGPAGARESRSADTRDTRANISSGLRAQAVTALERITL